MWTRLSAASGQPCCGHGSLEFGLDLFSSWPSLHGRFAMPINYLPPDCPSRSSSTSKKTGSFVLDSCSPSLSSSSSSLIQSSESSMSPIVRTKERYVCVNSGQAEVSIVVGLGTWLGCFATRLIGQRAVFISLSRQPSFHARIYSNLFIA